MSSNYCFDNHKYSTHNTIINNIGQNKVICDIGCNKGYLGQKASSTNQFYGLDFSQEQINKLKEKSFYKDAIQYDLNNLTRLPWNIKFDLLIFADVLEHTLFPKNILRFFVMNYLKDDGEVIISLPNIANWQIRIQLLMGEFNYTNKGILDKTHLHFYTFKTANLLGENCNLDLKKNLYGASFLGPLIKIFPFSKGLFATNIIQIYTKSI